MSEDLLWLECQDCAGVQAFVRPPCADGHGPACPEWCCTECGAAVLLGLTAAGVAGRARRELRGAA